MLTLSTTVQVRNRLGRLYFGMVKPFHRMVVPSMMGNMIRALEKGGVRADAVDERESQAPLSRTAT